MAEDHHTMKMQPPTILPGSASLEWEAKLGHIVDLTREISRQTDPQEMVRAYGRRMRQLIPVDRLVAVSRRNLSSPWYQITRSDLWTEEVNPWKQPHKLPRFDRGLLGDLLYGDQPRIMDDVTVDPGDPAHEYFDGQRSLIATPIYDGGVALNMVVLMRRQPAAFSREQFADYVLMTNLFGRATNNLVISGHLQTAYETIDKELRAVAAMQRSLLPAQLPKIPSMDLAVHYQTSRRAGGDYYDFFPLPDGRWGILIADVSGHGTPAAVMMAITHSIAHAHPGPPSPPGKVLEFVNRRLCELYTSDSNTFVTAFYGIYNPKGREFQYAIAGHNPPRVKRCEDGSMFGLDGVAGLPLGIIPEEIYEETTHVLRPADQIIFYTDGITEAANAGGELYGVARLDAALYNCRADADSLIRAVLDDVENYTGGAPATDDQTLLVAKVW